MFSCLFFFTYSIISIKEMNLSIMRWKLQLKRKVVGFMIDPLLRFCLPDDLHQLTHVDMIRNQELGLVQNRKLFLSLIPLDDHLQTANVKNWSQSNTLFAGQKHPDTSEPEEPQFNTFIKYSNFTEK
ncbi:hypothetical protein ILYODFUR_033963 [Ilyodon furcidens]|uniref:Uncharacterized protein n=1 Tax=Ilyodon furcidens TaxID=33524 RepID=A0ABV0TER7_9TELE